MIYQSELSSYIHEAIGSIDGTVGIFASLVGGKTIFAHRDKEQFPLESVYKLPIVVECLRRVEKGEFDLEQRFEIQPEDVVSHSAIVDHRHFSYPGINLSLRNMIRLMIEYSDNTTSDIILKLVGGPAQVNRLLREYHFSHTSVDRFVAQAFIDDAKSPDGNGHVLIGQDLGTPEEMARLLSLIEERKILHEAMATFLLDCMKRCKTGTNRMRARLPPNAVIAQKTGSSTGHVNDVGIIELPGRSEKIVLVVFIKRASVSKKEAEDTIANIADAIYNFALNT